MASAVFSRGLTSLTIAPRTCAVSCSPRKCPVAVHRFDQPGKKFESSPSLPSSKLESTRINRAVKFQPPSLSTNAAAASEVTIEQGCAANATQSWEEYFRTLIDESEERQDTESPVEVTQASTERNGSTGVGTSSSGTEQDNLKSAIQAFFASDIPRGVQKAVEEVSVGNVTSNIKQIHNATGVIAREIDLSTRLSSYCIRVGAHNLKLDEMANHLMDVALKASIGRGLELDLHISLVLGSMHLELYAGPDRYAIIPCAFEIIPLAFMREGSHFMPESPAVLDGMKDKAVEQTPLPSFPGADSARASMHTPLMREGAVMGEASSQAIEDECDAQYIICDALPWEYVASQAWMG